MKPPDRQHYNGHRFGYFPIETTWFRITPKRSYRADSRPVRPE